MKLKTKQNHLFSLSLISIAMLTSPIVSAESSSHENGITKALQDTKAAVMFRARYEGVDQSGIDEDASALTLKSRITVDTGSYQNFTLGLEVDNVSALVDDYNSTTNGNTQYPVVADPTGTDVNQAYIKYGLKDFSATVGRQRILHNNQRFVGGVAWRQNEQTYDGARAQYRMGAFNFDYSYIHNVNGITDGNDSGDFHLFNASYKLSKSHNFAGFAYALDYDALNKAKDSSNTIGGLYNGKFGPVFVNASVASQSDAGDNTASYTAIYINAEVGSKFGPVTVLGGYELLGSDNGVGFSTPLATKHKFQGWADKFLGTPADGVSDIYVTVKGKVAKVNLAATMHSLTSDVNNIDYGTELNFSAAYSFNKNYNVLLKYANYSADDYASDTDKLWLQAVAKF
ncbi:MAG: alginate export family protein [Colwellia sp.]